MAAETRGGLMVGIISGVITGVLTVAIPAISWGSGVSSRVTALESRIIEQQQRIERSERAEELSRQWMAEIRDRLARIEGKLERR